MSSIPIEKVDEKLVKELIKAACTAREKAYAPYSNFQVGAAILTESGRIFPGCNIENASYGAACCAERVAIFHAVAQGERRFVAIALVTDTDDISSPCGICRQVLAEFNKDMKVISANIKGQYKMEQVEELLPRPFILNEPEAGMQ